MLSLAFGKRKSKKNAQRIRVVRTDVDPEPFTTSGVLEIRATPRTVHSALPEQASDRSPREPSFPDTPSPRVELELPNEHWFSSDILSLNHITTAVPPRGDSLPRIEEQEASEAGEVSGKEDKQEPSVGVEQDERAGVVRKSAKGAPAPIRIPNPEYHKSSKYQIQRSGDASAELLNVRSNKDTTDASPLIADDASTISAYTLPGSIIGGSTLDHRYSRYLTRQDSATLPHGEHPGSNSPQSQNRPLSSNTTSSSSGSRVTSSIPPVPPLPTPTSPAEIAVSRPNDGQGGNGTVTGLSVSKSNRAAGTSRQSKPPVTNRMVETPPVSRTPNTTRIFLPGMHMAHSVSPVTEASASIKSSPGTPEREPASSTSTKRSQPSPLSRPTRTGTSDSDQYLSPSTYPQSRASPHSNLSTPSGEDIDEVLLDEYLPPNLFGRSPSTASSTGGDGHSVSSASVGDSGSKGRKTSSQLSDNRDALPTSADSKTQLSSRLRSSSLGDLRHSRSSLQSKPSPLHPSALHPIGERLQESPGVESNGLKSTPGISHLFLHHPADVPSSASTSSHSSAGILVSRSNVSPSDSSHSQSHTRPGDVAIMRFRGHQPLNPITVVRDPTDPLSFDIAVNDEIEESGGISPPSSGERQTFPETPSAFSPMFSANLRSASPGMSPALASGRSDQNSAFRRMRNSARLSSKNLNRSLSHGKSLTRGRSWKNMNSNSRSPLMPSEPVPSTSTSARDQSGPPDDSSGVLRIQSATQSTIPLPPSSSSSTPIPPPPPPPLPTSFGLQPSLLLVPPPPHRDSATKLVPGPSPVSQRRGSPSPSGTHSSSSSSRHLPASLSSQSTAPSSSLVSIAPPAPTIFQEVSYSGVAPPNAPPPAYDSLTNISESPANSQTQSQTITPSSTVGGRRTSGRPPLPIGPRSRTTPGTAPLTLDRNRSGSTSSVGYGGAGGASTRRPSTASTVHPPSAPRFQASRVKFKGYTMEAAKWKFTSSELQSIVSRAIRQSAEPSSIRLLPVNTLDNELPHELERLEALQAELKTKYKLQVRRRNNLLTGLAAHADGGREINAHSLRNLVDDLQDVSHTLDQVSEDLYFARDQAAQLVALEVTHAGSALAMALRKLNASYLKRSAQVQALQEQINALEAEREEAWSEAQRVAQDLDDLNDVLQDVHPGNSAISASRRSSRVLASRKSSIRVSKAGLRRSSSVSGRRSRTSMGSQFRASGVPTGSLPSSAFQSDLVIPPVPPVPHVTPLGINTKDLSARTSAYTSDFSPSEETHALHEAQRELCTMLGISMQDIRRPRQRPSSMSASPDSVPSRMSLVPIPRPQPRPRPRSEIIGSRASAAHRDVGVLDAFQSLPPGDRDMIMTTLGLLE